MNSEIEQRIVAMYFDNKDFEKNARQTINTLGELKNNLNLEDAAQGFNELDRAGKKLNLSQARSTINNFKDSIGGLQGVLKKAFDIGTAPIRSLNNFFNTFRGYVGKFVGFDLASKFVNSLETGLRQLTVAPIEQGWQMYQANVDSTKTIMSGTLKSYKEQMSKNNADWTYNEEEHMEYVKGQLKELSDYAQKTVFSLSDMTSNVGKFTNQNIDLETSVTAMEGIANMTAKAGQGAQQASMAMYNFSQALGVGKMTTIDWKSIENANLATTELKDLFIQTAAAGGQLEKVITEDSTGKKLEQFFITVDKNGKKLAKNKWIEVSAENFRDSLSNGWLDKETMLRVMQLYSNQVTDLDTLASWGFDTHDEELMKYLFNIGDEAEKAATQVRTFAKMWDAMTESVQSGWADSMQYIFGDMLEATEFWTTVNEKIGSVLDGAAERRNNLLREWRGLTFNEETGEWERLEGAIDGREDLIQGIYETIDAAKDLGGAFSKAWEDVFGHLTGKRLQEITSGFRDFIGRFRKWLGDVNDADSRLGKIRSGLSGVFNVLKLVGKGVETVFGMAKKIVMPLIDPVLNLFDKFGKFMKMEGVKNLGDALTLLRDKFSALWNKITGLGWSGVFSKIGGWLGNLWTEIRTGLSNFLTDNGLSGVVDWFVGIGDGLKGAFETVKTWLSESGIGEMFSNLWDTVSGLFKPTEEGGDSPIVTFFKTTFENVKGYFEEVKAWPIWNTIGTFFSQIWETLSGIFAPEKQSAMIGSERREWTTDAPIVAFFKNAFEGVKSFFEEVKAWPIWNTIGTFFENVWNTLSGIFSPEKQSAMINGERREWTTDAPIVAFFKNAFEGVKSFFEEVKAWPIWNTIGTFFSNIWETLSGIFTPEKQSAMIGSERREWTTEPPIVKFFSNAFEGVKNFFEEVQGWPIWNTIGTFFSNIWEKLSGIFSPEKQSAMINGERREWTTDAPIVKFFSNAFEGVKNFFEEVKGWEIWTTIGDFFSGVWDGVVGAFQPQKQSAMIGTERREWTADAPIVTFFKQLWADMQSVWKGITGWFESSGIKEFIADAWSWFEKQAGGVIDWFSKPAEDGKTGFVVFLEDFAAAVQEVWGHIQNDIPWNEIGKFFGDIWGHIMSFFHGGEDATESAQEVSTEAKTAVAAAKEVEMPTEENASVLERIIGAITDFVTKIVDKVKDVVIPEGVQKFFSDIFDFLEGILTFVSNVLGRIGRVASGKSGFFEEGGGWLIAVGIIAGLFQGLDLLKAKFSSGKETQSLASKFMGLSLGILALSASISLLSNIDSASLWKGVGAIAVVGTVVGVVVGLLSKLTSKRTGLAAVKEQQVTSTERILTTLITSLEKVGMVAVALALLPGVINAFGEAKKLAPELAGKDILDTLLGLAAFVSSVSIGLGVVSKLTGNAGIDPLAAIKTMISILGVVAVGLGGLLGAGGLLELADGIVDKIVGKDVDTVQPLVEALDKVKRVLNAFGDAISGFFAGLLGIKTDEQKQQAAMNNLNALAEASDKFSVETTSSILRILDMIGRLTEITKDIDVDKMDNFQTYTENLARGILKFSWIFEGVDENLKGVGAVGGERYKNFQGAIDLVKQTIGAFEGLKGFGEGGMLTSFDHAVGQFVNFTENDELVDAFVTGMNKLIDSFGGLSDGSNVNFEGLKIIESMYNAIETAFTDSSESMKLPPFNATPIVDSIIKAIGLGETAIAHAVHDMVQAGLNASGTGKDGEEYAMDEALKNFLNNPTSLGGLTQNMAQYEELLYGKGGTSENPAEDSLLGMFKGFTSELDSIEVPDMSEKIKNSFTFKDPTTGEDLDIAASLRETLGTFQDELNKAPEFEIKIVPTFDMKNLTAEALQAALGSRPILMPFGGQVNGGNMTIDFTGLAASLNLDGIRTQLSGIYDAIMAGQYNIVAAIDRMEGSIYNVSSAIAGIRLYLDTGALVGGITPLVDKALGQRANNARSTGVSPMLGNPFGNVFSPVTPAVHP